MARTRHPGNRRETDGAAQVSLNHPGTPQSLPSDRSDSASVPLSVAQLQGDRAHCYRLNCVGLKPVLRWTLGSAPDGTRTHNLHRVNETLLLLSYGGTASTYHKSTTRNRLTACQGVSRIPIYPTLSAAEISRGTIA